MVVMPFVSLKNRIVSIEGLFLGCPCDEIPSILGSVLGPVIVGNLGGPESSLL